MAGSWSASAVPSPVLWLGALSLRIPGIRWLAMRVAGGQVQASERILDADLMQSLHRYTLLWTAEEVRFSVDDQEVHRSPASPGGPLGFVAWMDNQFAVVEPSGAVRFGHLEIKRRQWMELTEIAIRRPDG